MDIVTQLNDELLAQPFTEEERASNRLDDCKRIALMYAKTENSIAVLSDMRTNTSYVYYGGVAESLGLAKRGDSRILHTIWEKEIFNRVHPDDLLKKHTLELRFIHFLRSVPEIERADYYIENRIRMQNGSGRYIPVLHRMFYIASYSNNSIWLALCLYNSSADTALTGLIINSVNGETLDLGTHLRCDLLSEREMEILRLIDRGMVSKEIALILSISIHTVNRHRQNILEKLHVSNSIEACRMAKELKLL